MADKCDLVLVIGSKNSSNSNRLVDVARDLGTPSYLIDNAGQIDEAWLTEDTRIVGVSSGASVPEALVDNLVAFFRERGTQDVQEFEVLREDVRFMLPKQIRQAMTAAAEA
jgi:4-hydroxy-3-methylbut-2-enyl diphosphate reductase